MSFVFDLTQFLMFQSRSHNVQIWDKMNLLGPILPI